MRASMYLYSYSCMLLCGYQVNKEKKALHALRRQSSCKFFRCDVKKENTDEGREKSRHTNIFESETNLNVFVQQNETDFDSV